MFSKGSNGPGKAPPRCMHVWLLEDMHTFSANLFLPALGIFQAESPKLAIHTSQDIATSQMAIRNRH